jgi:hypothetical protein
MLKLLPYEYIDLAMSPPDDIYLSTDYFVRSRPEVRVDQILKNSLIFNYRIL